MPIRPLVAALGDLLSQDMTDGGLGFGATAASAACLMVIAAWVWRAQPAVAQNSHEPNTGEPDIRSPLRACDGNRATRCEKSLPIPMLPICAAPIQQEGCPAMRFSTFIRDNLPAIIADWDAFARTLLPAARTMSKAALRDHSREILLAICNDMERRQTEAQRSAKSMQMTVDGTAPESAAATHGELRHLEGFDLLQLVGEFRAMRASVLALWRRSAIDMTGDAAIEEIIRFNEALDQALAESVDSYSARVDVSRDMFMAVLGHDLRGPLSGIAMTGLLLAKPGLSEATLQQASARIGRASKAMNRLITDLLEFTSSRLGSGIPIEKSACDLRKICDEAVDAARAEHPAVQFDVQMSGELDIDADVNRLQQVLSNLLSNAVQHGDRRQPVALSADGRSDDIVLRVANQGSPIPPGALQVIFEPLVQAPSDASDLDERSKTSLGLGLYIVREIVRGHDGNITVQSSAEAGTEFTIQLPRRRS